MPSSQRKQKAFVLLDVEPGFERKVMNDLLKIDEVREVHIVPGDWDLLAVVQTEKGIVVGSDERVYDVVIDKIHKVRHIRDTNTMVSHFGKTKA
ncbi:MAG: Lrp/AsnC ligand binding domain-containing protein [Thaumarchaeota archaeon]|nr:Lrp/AsnC ligand binding domain-containing protein [Nitrososphaerota archaeon]